HVRLRYEGGARPPATANGGLYVSDNDPAVDLPIGRSFDCLFETFVPTLTFVDAAHLRLDIPGDTGTDRQTVDVAPVVLRDGLVLLSWTERNGTVVFHVHDYTKGLAYSHARLPDGVLVRSRGEIRWH